MLDLKKFRTRAFVLLALCMFFGLALASGGLSTFVVDIINSPAMKWISIGGIALFGFFIMNQNGISGGFKFLQSVMWGILWIAAGCIGAVCLLAAMFWFSAVFVFRRMAAAIR